MIVGLGNVGREFEGTRHNVGFIVVDEVASKFKKNFISGKGEYYISEMRHGGQEVVLLKPTTFMNNSGTAVKSAADKFEIPIQDLLVVHDDFNIPLSKIRLRKGGSDGGHNGVYSIIYHLNDDGFPRLRCGIGTEDVLPGKDMVGFVLSKFEAGEIPQVDKMVRTAADAVFVFINEGIETAMNKFN
ncbi:MAG: aminoacyl-tRNA hydrolase [Candidatus Kryptoniota bacterium]